MIKLVVLGKCLEPTSAEELAFGWRALQRSLPKSAVVHLSPFEDRAPLWDDARKMAEQMHLAGSDRVLILPHPHWMLAPQSLSLLNAALDLGARCALGSDAAHVPACAPPDYCTARGLERYANRLAKLESGVATALRPASLTLATVEFLQPDAASRGADVVEVAGAFAHDFSGYQQGRREEVMPLVPRSAHSFLDVGGGQGGFLRALKSSRPCETHLAEFSAAACSLARGHVDRVWQGDFLNAAFDRSFDCISFLDVLEHTTEPLKWLGRAHTLLAPGGSVIASIPNVAHWFVIADLLEGRWDYAPVGIHCITHLRFFTRHGIEQLFEQAGMVIEETQSTRVHAPDWFHVSMPNSDLRVDDDSWNTYAYIVRARRADESAHTQKR